MKKKPLPSKPSLDHLKQQARDLLKALRAGNPGAIERLNVTSPGRFQIETASAGNFKLADAQRVIAREYGLSSWARLKREVERRSLSSDERRGLYVKLVTSGHLKRAARLLEDEPDIATAGLYTACVRGDWKAVAAALDEDADWATRTGGPCGKDWTLLHYVCFSHLNRESESMADGLLRCAELLLDRGADANAAHFHPSWPQSPQRPLYGAAGEANHPRLAKLLIDAGAIIDDGEAIYHACEHHHLECMELLRDSGLDLSARHETWQNTVLYFLLGYTADADNAETCGLSIQWLLQHGVDTNARCGSQDETALHRAVEMGHPPSLTEALLQAGADPNAERKDGLSPYRLALMLGMEEHAKLMQGFGATPIEQSTKERLIALCYRGEAATAAALVDAQPGLLDQLEPHDRKQVNNAARRNLGSAVRAFHAAGFDLDYIGPDDWDATALHWSSWHGQYDSVQALLDCGASVTLKANKPEDSPPLCWAAHGSGNSGNRKGDYVGIVRALLAAGAKPHESYINMSSPDVQEVLLEHLP